MRLNVKSIIWIILSCVSVATFAQQNSQCTVTNSYVDQGFIPSSTENLPQILSAPPKVLKIKIFIVQPSNGTVTYTDADIMQNLNLLNTEFSPANISFQLIAPIQRINSDHFYYDIATSPTIEGDLHGEYATTGNLNWFYVWRTYNVKEAGFASSRPGESIVVTSSALDWVPAHEVGHCLGLDHTSDTTNYMTPARSTIKKWENTQIQFMHDVIDFYHASQFSTLNFNYNAKIGTANLPYAEILLSSPKVSSLKIKIKPNSQWYALNNYELTSIAYDFYSNEVSDIIYRYNWDNDNTFYKSAENFTVTQTLLSRTAFYNWGNPVSISAKTDNISYGLVDFSDPWRSNSNGANAVFSSDINGDIFLGEEPNPLIPNKPYYQIKPKFINAKDQFLGVVNFRYRSFNKHNFRSTHCFQNRGGECGCQL